MVYVLENAVDIHVHVFLLDISLYFSCVYSWEQKMLCSKVSAGKLSQIPPNELQLSQRLYLSTILALDHQECQVLRFFSPDFKPQ